MFSRIYRAASTGTLLVLLLLGSALSPRATAHETEWPGQKLASIFPKAKKFVQRSAVLTPAKSAAVEKELGTKLRAEDQKPIFYIPMNEKKKPMGLVLFVDVQGPRGVIDGAVGLDMKGKVVKVKVYNHNESDAITADKFLEQFIGMDIDSTFNIGEDVTALEGHEAASEAVALLPKKTLAMSYALFLKRKPKPVKESSGPDAVGKPPAPDAAPPEIEDLGELMMLMLDAYLEIADYFDTGKDKAKAVTAAEQLVTYAKRIADFEPPANTEQTTEQTGAYAALQGEFVEALTQFADALEKEGISDETRAQWETIEELVNQAHHRFSGKEIDLEAY